MLPPPVVISSNSNNKDTPTNLRVILNSSLHSNNNAPSKGLTLHEVSTLLDTVHLNREVTPRILQTEIKAPHLLSDQCRASGVPVDLLDTRRRISSTTLTVVLTAASLETMADKEDLRQINSDSQRRSPRLGVIHGSTLP